MTAVLLLAAGLWSWPRTPELPGRPGVPTTPRIPVRAALTATLGGFAAAPAVAALLATGSASVTGAALIGGATAAWTVRSLIVRRRETRDALAVLDAVRSLQREIAAGADLDTAVTEVRRSAGPAVDRLLSAVRSAVTDDGAPVPPTGPAFALTAAARLSHRTGVPLAGLLSGIADGLADERRAADHRATAVAGARMSAGVLAVLPLMGVLLGTGMGADPVPVLVGGGLGSVLLLTGTTLLCAGLLWSSRIAR